MPSFSDNPERRKFLTADLRMSCGSVPVAPIFFAAVEAVSKELDRATVTMKYELAIDPALAGHVERDLKCGRAPKSFRFWIVAMISVIRSAHVGLIIRRCTG
jgi:hypothetical protein